ATHSSMSASPGSARNFTERRRTMEQIERLASGLQGLSHKRGAMEHRWGHRREISRPVRVGTRNGLLARGRITNVSMSGAFVVSPLPVTLFSHVRILFTAMVDGRRASTTVEGQVVRRDASGFGVEWSEFAPECVRSLVLIPPFRMTEPPQ